MFDLLIGVVLVASLLAGGYSFEVVFVGGIFSVLAVVTLGLGLIYFGLSAELFNWFVVCCLSSCLFITYIVMFYT